MDSTVLAISFFALGGIGTYIFLIITCSGKKS